MVVIFDVPQLTDQLDSLAVLPKEAMLYQSCCFGEIQPILLEDVIVVCTQIICGVHPNQIREHKKI